MVGCVSARVVLLRGQMVATPGEDTRGVLHRLQQAQAVLGVALLGGGERVFLNRQVPPLGGLAP